MISICKQGLDALMMALSAWNGGVIVISHDERFITTVAKEVSAPLSGLPALIGPVQIFLSLCSCGCVAMVRSASSRATCKRTRFVLLLGLVVRSVAECRAIELDR